MEKMTAKIKKATVSIFSADIMTAADAVAFGIIMGIFPFLLFVIGVLSQLDIDYELYAERIIYILPEKVKETILFFCANIKRLKGGVLVPLSLAVSVYSASSGFENVIMALNTEYDIKETRGFFKIKLLAVFYVIVFSLLAFGAICVMVIEDRLTGGETLGYVAAKAAEVGVLWLLCSFIYRTAVNRNVRFADVRSGAFFTAVLWVTVSEIFDAVTTVFVGSSGLYGAMGSVILFFYWIKLLSYIFLMGGKINAENGGW